MHRLLATLLSGTLAGAATYAHGAGAHPASPERVIHKAERGALSPVPTSAERVPGLSSARQPILDHDARLESAVTLRLKKSPLSAVVAEIGRQVGVTLKAAPEVADEPAIVFATDQPAREVMRHLARLFQYRWTRQGEPGRYVYELFQDLPSRQEEEARRLQRDRRALEAVQAGLRQRWQLAQRHPEQLQREAAVHEAPIDRFEQLPEAQRFAARETPEFQALQQRAAWSYALREMGDPFRRALCRLAVELTSPQWEALMNGETIRLGTRPEPGSTLMPAGLAADLRAARPSALPAGARPFLAAPEEEAGYRQVAQQTQDAWAAAQGLRVSVRLELASEPGGSQAVLSVTPTALMPAEYHGLSPSLPSLIVAGRGTSAPDRRAPPDMPLSADGDPLLATKRPFQITRSASAAPGGVGSLNEILVTIAETYGVNLVADAYRAEAAALSGMPLGEALSLSEALNRHVLPNARWSREGAFVHVRRHNWQHARRAEIPERVVNGWAAHLRQTRGFSLEDTARLALTLRDEQLAQFAAVMAECGIAVSVPFAEERSEYGKQQRALLRAYGSLLPGQRRALQAGRGVAYPAMPPGARRWLSAALASQHASAEPGPVRQQSEASTGGLFLTAPGRSPVREDAESVPLTLHAAAAEGRLPHEVQFRFLSGAHQEEVVSLPLPQVDRAAASPTGSIGGVSGR